MITSQEVDRLIDTIWEPEDTEPTEITFRVTTDDYEQDNGPATIAWAFLMGIGMVFIAAFLIVGGK